MRKILRINLTEESYEMSPVPAHFKKLGGRALSSAIVAAEVPAKSDPLGPENRIILVPGILAGSRVSCSGRLSIGTKSPLTGTIKEANAGGELANQISKLGIHAVIIEGMASKPTLLKIDTEGVGFTAADGLQGSGTYECIRILKKDDPKSGIIAIGPAGEKKLLASAIVTSTRDSHLRFAARGGVGAVMGSKNLKAIVVNDENGEKPTFGDEKAMGDAARAFSKLILTHPLSEGLKALGTPLLVNAVNGMSALSTKNFSQGKYEKAEQISGETLAGITASRRGSKPSHACMSGCVIQCSNVLTDEQGELICSSIEFETIGLMGSNCMIDDVEMVAKMNRAANDMGLDTMEVGGALGIAMEQGLLPWGDGETALKIIYEVKTGGENGLMIGNGAQYTGDKLGATRIPAVKRQCLSAYDPRGLKGTGVTYATATMGADHTCGNVLPSPTQPEYNPIASTGQAEPSKYLQGYFAAIDSLGLCLFASLPMLDIPDLKQLVIDAASAALGEKLDQEYIEQLGAEVLKTERGYNLEAGFTNADDRLPEFFTKEKLPELDTAFDVSEEELDSVYAE